ncbi:MAG: DUF1566 domain-containing protein [Deltaproteobacteria bacterium]|nr:DUF1566 domain-containing protein [Deltaproteobacteria bacterium]
MTRWLAFVGACCAAILCAATPCAATTQAQRLCDFARTSAWKDYTSCIDRRLVTDLAIAKCRYTYIRKWESFQRRKSLTGSTCIGARFTDNGGTVTDNLSGLVWEKKINQLTEYYAAANPSDLTAGPDGNLWFPSGGTHEICKITTDGVITRYLEGTAPNSITVGPDGNLWFTSYADKVGNITTAGVVTEYSVPTVNSAPMHITAGSDGNLWFTENRGDKIGKVTLAGVVTEYPLPPNTYPNHITAGADGNVWFTKACCSLGKVTPAGEITFVPIPGDATGITTGPDGNLWISLQIPDSLAKMTADGSITLYPLPPNGGATGIAGGADGNMWFTHESWIGKLTPAGVVTEWAVGAEGIITMGPDGNVWIAKDGAQRIAKFPIAPSPHEQHATFAWSAGGVNEDGAMFTTFLNDPVTGLNTSGFAGSKGWRIPTIAELDSFILQGFPCTLVACTDPIFGALPYNYWSMTSTGRDSHHAWLIDFDVGWVNGVDKAFALSMFAVRGGL